MKINMLLFVFLFKAFTDVEAQNKKMEDVIYLKSGGVMRGYISEQNDLQVKIQTTEGNIFVFRKDEISRINKEMRWQNLVYKKRGFFNFTELGPLIAGKTTIDGVTTAAFSFQTINGYKFSQYVQPGLGVGADLYATQTIIPIFGSIRGDLSMSGAVIPFYFGDIGYGWNITQNSSNARNFNGGLMYAIGLGLKIPFNRTAGFLVSVGYRYQQISFVSNDIKNEVIYNRLAIRAGFFL